MKRLISILLFSLLVFLLPQCDTDSNKSSPQQKRTDNQKESPELKTSQDSDALIDSTKLLTFNEERISKSEIIDSCLQFIRSHYKEQFYNAKSDTYYDNYKAHELTLKKHKTYEDSLLFIISFYEQEKHKETDTKSYSSIIFKKEENKLTQLTPHFSDSLSFRSLPLIDNLEYPGRFSGVPFLITDLTGDDKSDFIFRSEASLKLRSSDDDSPSTEYLIYYQDGNKVKVGDIHYQEFVNRSDTGIYRKEVNFNLLENSLGAPLLQFEVNEYKENSQQKKTDNTVPRMRTVAFYQWNKKTEAFERL